MFKESNSNVIYKGLDWENYWHSESQWLKDIREWEREQKMKEGKDVE